MPTEGGQLLWPDIAKKNKTFELKYGIPSLLKSLQFCKELIFFSYKYNNYIK